MDKIDKRLQKQALGRLLQLMEDAREQQMHGQVGVFVKFEGGRPKIVRRLIDATDK